MIIKFSGHSDDTFMAEWEGVSMDHDDCAMLSVRTFHLIYRDERMAVTGVYGKECLWSVGIAPIEEDGLMPSWPMTWRFEGYTAILELEVPPETKIRLAWPERTGVEWVTLR